MIADKGCTIVIFVTSLIPIFALWCMDDASSRKRDKIMYLKLYLIIDSNCIVFAVTRSALRERVRPNGIRLRKSSVKRRYAYFSLCSKCHIVVLH